MGSINLVVGGTAGLVLDLIINEPNVLASELGVLVGCGDGVRYGKVLRVRYSSIEGQPKRSSTTGGAHEETQRPLE